MIKLIESNRGTDKSIPQMLMAGASVDDINVIVLFTSLIEMTQNNSFSFISFMALPFTILAGILLGAGIGVFLVWLFKKIHIRDTIKVLIIFSFAFLMIALQEWLKPILSISGLIGVITMGIVILKKYVVLAKRLVGKFEKIWVFAEIILFVLVGAAVDIRVIPTVGLQVILLIIIALIIRSVGVFLSVLKTDLSKREKLFVIFAYLPKATVQAAIGSIPLGLGLPNGQLILAVAVISILITAPLGAILIDSTSKKWLKVSSI
jgi:NhaP-type Na+/H+ or K+/H+ antiporter